MPVAGVAAVEDGPVQTSPENGFWPNRRESALVSLDVTTASHVFMIGSTTKELTRVLGFVLEEKGYISSLTIGFLITYT